MVNALKIIARKNGADYKEISLFDLCQIPIYTKFLFGPILDRYYSKSFGKRMSYIVPFSVVLVGLFVWLGLASDVLV